jgi:hypothetical protein
MKLSIGATSESFVTALMCLTPEKKINKSKIIGYS